MLSYTFPRKIVSILTSIIYFSKLNAFKMCKIKTLFNRYKFSYSLVANAEVLL